MAKTIELNARETQLKNLLVDVAGRIDRDQARTGELKEPLVLRWAGGWVRDKLLGIDSHDIDTAINTMTGETFAVRLTEICETPEVRENHQIRADDIGRLHKVSKNPEKSKHLETTTRKLFGLDVDFVNLRKETYTDDSRNPQMEFGTAEEDALRRDATINALFYNLQTGEVEDFTGGLSDMAAKLIRTPLEPFQTFMDDPLRVLRLIRFASRLEFSIDPAAEQMMGDTGVLEALKLKISRERIGIELEKMLKGKHPCDSLRLIDRLGLFHTVFTDPSRPDMPKPDIANWKAAYECLDALAVKKAPGSIYDILVRSEESAYFAWVLAALTPWELLPDMAPQKPGKLPIPLATLAGREGIKAPNKLSDLITEAHRHRLSILELKDAVHKKEPCVTERDCFGMAIRGWDSRGGPWHLQVLYALLVEVMERTREIPSSLQEVLSEWQEFLDHLQELDVMDAPSIKRLLDGRQLADALGVRAGKWMAPALDIVMAWQLRNPGQTDATGAVEEVMKRKDELGIP